MKRTSVTIASFVCLSLAMHGLLFFINANPEVQPALTRIGEPVLSISLSSTKQPAQKKIEPANVSTVIATSRSTTRPVVPEDIEKHSTARQIKKIASVDKKIQPLKTSPVTPTGLHKQNITRESALRNYLLGEINSRLSRHITYPTRARRRGWEGSVLIGFKVDKQGYLQNVHLSRTSGYTLLDTAALSALKKVNNIPITHWGDHIKATNLQLPVIYRLTNS